MLKKKDLKKGMYVYWNVGGYVGKREIYKGRVVSKNGKLYIKRGLAFYEPDNMELFTGEEKNKYTTGDAINKQIIIRKELVHETPFIHGKPTLQSFSGNLKLLIIFLVSLIIILITIYVTKR